MARVHEAASVKVKKKKKKKSWYWRRKSLLCNRCFVVWWRMKKKKWKAFEGTLAQMVLVSGMLQMVTEERHYFHTFMEHLFFPAGHILTALFPSIPSIVNVNTWLLCAVLEGTNPYFAIFNEKEAELTGARPGWHFSCHAIYCDLGSGLADSPSQADFLLRNTSAVHNWWPWHGTVLHFKGLVLYKIHLTSVSNNNTCL